VSRAGDALAGVLVFFDAAQAVGDVTVRAVAGRILAGGDAGAVARAGDAGAGVVATAASVGCGVARLSGFADVFLHLGRAVPALQIAASRGLALFPLLTVDGVAGIDDRSSIGLVLLLPAPRAVGAGSDLSRVEPVVGWNPVLEEGVSAPECGKNEDGREKSDHQACA